MILMESDGRRFGILPMLSNNCGEGKNWVSGEHNIIIKNEVGDVPERYGIFE